MLNGGDPSMGRQRRGPSLSTKRGPAAHRPEDNNPAHHQTVIRCSACIVDPIWPVYLQYAITGSGFLGRLCRQENRDCGWWSGGGLWISQLRLYSVSQRCFSPHLITLYYNYRSKTSLFPELRSLNTCQAPKWAHYLDQSTFHLGGEDSRR